MIVIIGILGLNAFVGFVRSLLSLQSCFLTRSQYRALLRRDRIDLTYPLTEEKKAGDVAHALLICDTPLRNASQVVEKLKGDIALKATVLRGGSEKEVLAKDLVPGDIVVIDVSLTLISFTHSSQSFSLSKAIL